MDHCRIRRILRMRCIQHALHTWMPLLRTSGPMGCQVKRQRLPSSQAMKSMSLLAAAGACRVSSHQLWPPTLHRRPLTSMIVRPATPLSLPSYRPTMERLRPRLALVLGLWILLQLHGCHLLHPTHLHKQAMQRLSLPETQRKALLRSFWGPLSLRPWRQLRLDKLQCHKRAVDCLKKRLRTLLFRSTWSPTCRHQIHPRSSTPIWWLCRILRHQIKVLHCRHEQDIIMLNCVGK